MSFNEFLTKTMMDSTLNQGLSFAAFCLIGGGIECCREGKLKLNSALIGIDTFACIAMLAGVAYKSYKDFNMYTFGITALCTMAGAYLGKACTEEYRKTKPEEKFGVIQCIIIGAAIAAALAVSAPPLAAMACKEGQKMLSK